MTKQQLLRTGDMATVVQELVGYDRFKENTTLEDLKAAILNIAEHVSQLEDDSMK